MKFSFTSAVKNIVFVIAIALGMSNSCNAAALTPKKAFAYIKSAAMGFGLLYTGYFVATEKDLLDFDIDLKLFKEICNTIAIMTLHAANGLSPRAIIHQLQYNALNSAVIESLQIFGSAASVYTIIDFISSSIELPTHPMPQLLKKIMRQKCKRNKRNRAAVTHVSRITVAPYQSDQTESKKPAA